MTETVDPIQALRDSGAEDIAIFQAPARDPAKPWMVYGAGCAINVADFDDASVQEWRNEGVLSGVVGTYTPPPAPTISEVTVAAVAADTAQITWTTDIESDSQVNYGLDTSYGSSSVLEPGMVTSHTVDLSGLTAETLYHFSVASTANGKTSNSPDATFTTASAA